MRLFYKRILLFIWIFTIFTAVSTAQGNYYSSIDTSRSSFVTDLHNLIYPHTKLTYYTTAVADYVARDTTGGKKVVTCVYSGENYVYTPPFSWGTYSREHTWCHSWMPTYPSESVPEYSDQHHLFPTNQNKANAIRSNHPLGVVVNASYTYLQCKLGTNNLGYTVFEPRDSQKGDAARALFYMSVCYHGENGKDWSFNYLNTVILPSKNEGPQSVEILKQWHWQDPPDSLERARNDSIFKYQRNRNPFIDHPEWVNIINFYTMTKVSAPSYAPEPTNHATNFNASNFTDTSITLTWTKALPGIQPPTGYTLFVRGDNLFSNPIDGMVYSTDTTASKIIKTINLSATDSVFTVRNLQPATLYYFRLFSFNGDGLTRNYKTDGAVPYIFGQTTGVQSNTPDVVVNEYFNGSAQSEEWVELLVIKDKLDLRGLRVSDYSATGGEQGFVAFANVPFWENIPMGTFLVLLASGNAQTQDLDISDKKIIVNVTNTSYFSSGTASFNIAGTSDAIQLRNFAGTHIHALGHGSNINLNSIPTPKVIITGSSTSGNVVRFININSIADFSNSAKAVHGGTPTQGTPNDAAESTFVATVLPVELTRFIVTVYGNNVNLEWRTEMEVNNYGFEVERRALKPIRQTDGGQVSQKADESTQLLNGSTAQWLKVGFISGAGTSNSPKEYSYTDSKLFAGRYEYRLKQIDLNGAFKYSQSIEIEIGVPKEFALHQNYPNPFNPSTAISYQLSVISDVTLKVYDILGKEVATLVNQQQPAGSYEVQFNASHLASGVYFYRIQAGSYIAIKKLVLMK